MVLSAKHCTPSAFSSTLTTTCLCIGEAWATVCLCTGIALPEAGVLLIGHQGWKQCQVLLGQSLNKCTIEETCEEGDSSNRMWQKGHVFLEWFMESWPAVLGPDSCSKLQSTHLSCAKCIPNQFLQRFSNLSSWCLRVSVNFS